jgi:16S rRNA processing protein RimM
VARVCVGVVTGAHGLHGLVRVRPFTQVPEDVAAYGPVESEDGARAFTLEARNRTGKGQILVRVEGIEDRDEAEALKGERLYLDRARLPAADEDEFYHADLLGLSVVTETGVPVGEVRAVHNFGGGDMLEIAEADGGLATVPFTHGAVPEVDLANRRVTVVAGQILRAGDGDAGGEEPNDG